MVRRRIEHEAHAHRRSTGEREPVLEGDALVSLVAVFEILDRWAREMDERQREGGGADGASEP